jgi:putative ABC transport system substrate-binding protein
MGRCLLLLSLTLQLVLLATATWAQPANTLPVVGVLMVTAGPHDGQVEALRTGLRELGYVDGRNIRIEYRGAQGQADRLPRLAEELVRLKVDALVAGAESVVRAARQATGTIPIVVVLYDYDPVVGELIGSFSRPGGNITGIFTRQSELVGKHLELLKQALPGISRVAVFWDSFGRRQLEELEPAARALGIQLRLVQLQAPYDFEVAFRNARQKRAEAVTLLFSPVFYTQRAQIGALAVKYKLPMVIAQPDYVEHGGLISYGPRWADTWGHAACFIDRLLKGAKPSDLPVERTATFKLVVNLKTAQALGITIPESMLLRADELIR